MSDTTDYGMFINYKDVSQHPDAANDPCGCEVAHIFYEDHYTIGFGNKDGYFSTRQACKDYFDPSLELPVDAFMGVALAGICVTVLCFICR